MKNQKLKTLTFLLVASIAASSVEAKICAPILTFLGVLPKYTPARMEEAFRADGWRSFATPNTTAALRSRSKWSQELTYDFLFFALQYGLKKIDPLSFHKDSRVPRYLVERAWRSSYEELHSLFSAINTRLARNPNLKFSEVQIKKLETLLKFYEVHGFQIKRPSTAEPDDDPGYWPNPDQDIAVTHPEWTNYHSGKNSYQYFQDQLGRTQMILGNMKSGLLMIEIIELLKK
ncbi:MAG: hypothetical protein JWQ35_1656 [Bacteriovoracaceae bacterium]|nr:hypothetical protein [Bacteriovoracaceae bacterium]